MNRHLKCAIKVAFSPIVLLFGFLLIFIQTPIIIIQGMLLVSGCIEDIQDPWAFSIFEWYSEL